MAAAVLWASSATAQTEPPTIRCDFDPASATLTVTGAGFVRLDRETAEIRLYDSNIHADEIPCPSTDPMVDPGPPSVATVDAIDLDFAGGTWLFLNGGPLAPGRSPESGSPEIEVSVGDQIGEVIVFADPTAHRIELGSLGAESGINMNADIESEVTSDADFIFRGQPPVGTKFYWPAVSIYSSDRSDPVPDHFSADGGEGFDGPFPTGVSLIGRGGDDELVASQGPSVLHGEGGSDRTIGGPARDLMGDCAGSNIAEGGGDDDVIVAHAGDLVEGGDGRDRATFCAFPPAGSTEGISLDLRQEAAQELVPGVPTVVRGIEDAEGTEYDDRLIGDAGANVFWDQGGDDSFVGNEGNDRVLAWTGDDTLVGGPGRDTLRGQGGIDHIDARDRERDRRINCGAGDIGLEHAAVDTIDPKPRSC